jgi:hypothetical protein
MASMVFLAVGNAGNVTQIASAVRLVHNTFLGVATPVSPADLAVYQ